MALVYRHRRNDTGDVFYIGIGKNKSRSCSNHSRSIHWYNIVNKVGYTSEIIMENLCWEQAQQMEIMLISRYGRNDNGTGKLVNHTDGGDGILGYKFSAQSKKFRSNRMQGAGNHFFEKIHTTITRKILSDKCGRSGEENGFYGKSHTDEVREMLRNTARDRYETGTLPKLPIMFGSANPSSKAIIAINHNNNSVFFIHGGIKRFCVENELSYHYYKLFCNKGKCKIIKPTHIRTKTKNMVNWEFRTAGLAGGDWGRIKKIIQNELVDCKTTVVIYKQKDDR